MLNKNNEKNKQKTLVYVGSIDRLCVMWTS